jgi:acyl-CoA synthetase (AMP-forming)/AMP-acid ligase II
VACLLAPLWSGGAVIASPGFDVRRFFAWLAEMRPDWYSAVPTMHGLIVDHAARAGMGHLRGLRLVRSSSAALPRATFEALGRLFECPVVEAYGMTEASHQIASNGIAPGGQVPGTVGHATGTEIRILSPEGRRLPPGERGEVAIRGPSVHAGYLGDEKATARAFHEGWFRTGDQGFLSADGRLTLTGRFKEMINRGGEKIAPLEIDDVLMAHPEVKMAVAFAMPHPQLGEDVAAAVVLSAGSVLDEAALRRWLSERLARFKVPRRILIVPDIPRGGTGKIQRIGLAARLGLA